MTLLDFLFPRTCLGCGGTGQYFCSSCISQIRSVDQICPVCEKPSPFGETHRFCRRKHSLDGLVSFFAYEGIIRKAIHQLKFKYVTDLSTGLMELMQKGTVSDRFSRIKQFVKDKKPVIIPVPLYWYKENQRGFNQAEIFAQKFAELWKLEYKKGLLMRSKFTPPQAGLTQNQRKRNIANAFYIHPNIQYPVSNIILIDDIWTTGATLKTCGALLKKSRAEIVWGLTLAR